MFDFIINVLEERVASKQAFYAALNNPAYRSSAAPQPGDKHDLIVQLQAKCLL